MGQEPPKLYVNKPKKAQLKHGHQRKVMESSAQATATAASKPPEPLSASFYRRYRFLVPLLLGVNLFVGVYVLTRSKAKGVPTDEEEEEEVPVSHESKTPTTTPVKKPSPSPPSNPVKKHEPIPETQQRELFKWMLEEKRKIKPKDTDEKKRLDEEKAILKQIIRAKTIPPI